ncbi:MAG: type IV pilus modification PilV family protein [Dictyoglomaceae bacterium]
MKKGFTFIEVLVSILLLSIVVTSFFMGISNILIEDELIKAESQATVLAEKKLEEYRTKILNNWTATFTLSGDFSQEGWTSFRYIIYTSNFSSTNSLRKVKIFVWNDRNNNYTLDSLEAKSVLLTIISRRK